MIYYGQELYHHGIKGQRWGIRRYQNEDGTLTPAGKKRYLNDDGSLNDKGKIFKEKVDAKYTKKNPEKAKYASELRDQTIDSYTKSIIKGKKEIEENNKIMNTPVDKLNFDSEAKKAIDDELESLKEIAPYRDYYMEPTRENAIKSWFIYETGDFPTKKNLTEKDVSDQMKEDAKFLKDHGTYEKLNKMEEEYINSYKKIIDSIKDMTLEEIYNNRNNLDYEYWRKKGYYDSIDIHKFF